MPRVYNTLSKTKEPFEPLQPGKVGIYLCGPTVYKPSHVGHAVGPIIFDAIKRYLIFRGYSVNWVVNITDVDDKLIDEAAKQNTSTFELAERITADYLLAMSRLHVDSIDIMPKASEHMDDIIAIIEKLIGRMELITQWAPGRQVFLFRGRTNLDAHGHKGSFEANWFFPIRHRLRGQFQVFSGYGESLIDYDHRQTTVGVGRLGVRGGGSRQLGLSFRAVYGQRRLP